MMRTSLQKNDLHITECQEIMIRDLRDNRSEFSYSKSNCD